LLFDHLLGQLLSGLLYRLVICLHLCGKVLFKHGILLYLVIPEAQRNLPADGYGCFTVPAVVEPCLCPPVDAALVAVYADKPGDVKALYINLKIRQRVDDALLPYCVILYFFF